MTLNRSRSLGHLKVLHHAVNHGYMQGGGLRHPTPGPARVHRHMIVGACLIKEVLLRDRGHANLLLCARVPSPPDVQARD